MGAVTQRLITCSMCGYTFAPALHAACQSCPLQKGCSLACCPHCGFETVDIQQSKLALLVARLLPSSKTASKANGTHLAGVKPGQQAKVVGFSSAIPADRQAHLQSYGLTPGRLVRVVQHSPVTVIQVEHTELALDTEIAREIRVQED